MRLVAPVSPPYTTCSFPILIQQDAGSLVLSIFGINHRTATLAEREPFQLSRREQGEAVLRFRRLAGVEETVILATCNRVEFYRADRGRGDHAREVVEFYRRRGVENPGRILELGYLHQGADAARHLFRVTAGLDSLLLGEEQIRGQVKDAYGAACAFGGPGKVLHKLFHHAFRVSKRIRSETLLGEGPRSIPGAAVDLLVGAGPENSRAVVVGADETTQVVLAALRRRGVPAVLINRSAHAAHRLAAEYGAEAALWDELPGRLAGADLLFSATGATERIIGPSLFAGGRERPILIADLAIPRDVD
ncbi:MAG TPA: glutamyl-tRNA reductase, partial [Bacteroidetes bacterium]|nr:glutamyl-tRNA reductase [Bacteroidota bacterium]